jgi:hypothetical protein
MKLGEQSQQPVDVVIKGTKFEARDVTEDVVLDAGAKNRSEKRQGTNLTPHAKDTAGNSSKSGEPGSGVATRGFLT